MRKIIKVLLLGFFLFCFVGCGKCLTPTATSIHDTVEVVKKVRLRDTVFRVPGASVQTSIPAPILSFPRGGKGLRIPSSFYERNRQASLSLSVVHDTIYAECKCDTMAIKAKLRDSIIRTEKRKTTVNTKIVEKRYVPLMVNILAWIGGISLLIFFIDVVVIRYFL